MHKLTRKIHSDNPAHTSLTLPYEQRIKSRQRLRLDNKEEAGLFLERGTILHDNDLLCSEDGFSVRVIAAPEPVSTACSNDSRMIALACYHLGNRHVPVEISQNRVRYQTDHVLDEMVRGLGLLVEHGQLPFSPETGAYNRHHGHDHAE